MPNFSYKALGRDGKEVRGVLQAESEAAAASRIRENYPILLSISQKKEKKRPDEGSLLEMEIGAGGSRRRSWRSCVHSLRSPFIRA